MRYRFCKHPWRFLPGGLAVIITLSVSWIGALEPLENLSYRYLFRLRGEKAWDDRIVVITIDDKTLAELNQYPLSRAIYTQLLDTITPARPAAIGFNILFVESSPVDAEFARAIAAADNVVLASGVDERGYMLRPTARLNIAAIATGHILKQVESDGLVRSLDPWRAQKPTLGMALAAVYAQEQAPVKAGPLWINWPGPLQHLTQYSLIDVLTGTVDPQVFANQLVLVGMTATGIDPLPTPFDDNPPASGIGLHAAVLDNLLQQRLLQPITIPWLWGLLLVVMPGVSYGLGGRPLLWQLVLTGSSLMAWLGLSLLLFHQAYWLPTAAPLLLLGLTGLGTSVGQQIHTTATLRSLLAKLWRHHFQNPSPLLWPLSLQSSIPEDLGGEVRKLVGLAQSLGGAQAVQTAIAQAVPIGLLAVNDQNQVWFCNQLATNWLGLHLGDQLPPALVPHWLDAATWQEVQQALLHGEAINPIECRQALQWFELRFAPLTSLAYLNALLTPHYRGILIIIEDITHRKSVELQLRWLNEGLEEEVRHRAQELERINLSLLKEIEERRQAQEQLLYQAQHDELTGLPNRAYFKTKLTTLIQQTHGQDAVLFAVLFIDCDRFKLINDSFGHLVGDELLQAIAQRLQTCIGESDLVARFGGDEFMILLQNILEPETAIAVAQRVRQHLNEPFLIREWQLYTGCSIGIVMNGPTYRQAEEMLRDADIAMYRAKCGRIGFTLFEPEMHVAIQSSLQLETDLRQAQAHQELVVYYQPIVNITTQQLVGFEALVRWQHPIHGIVGPDQFIPLAEETGLIVPIGQWVMEAACRQLGRWQQQQLLPPDTFISVNLSVQQFNEPHLLSRIDETLQATGLSSQYLKLEITESAIMANSDLAIQTFYRLKDRGIRLGIDDFGTGYSSLNYLHCFPIDFLKVDRSFIQRMIMGRKYLSLVQAVRTLAFYFDMTMIAEGIETAHQIEQLQAMDCHLGQGYFFYPPLPPQALEAQYFVNH